MSEFGNLSKTTSGDEYFICGGDDGDTLHVSCERFSFSTDEWLSVGTPSLPMGITDFAAVAFNANTFFLIGGNNGDSAIRTVLECTR